MEGIETLERTNKIIQLKERYKTLSEIHELFPRKGSNHRVFRHVDREMSKAIEELEEI